MLLWTVKPDLAFWAVIITEVWQWTPFMFVILMAAIANIDRSLVESARIDGAGAWSVFRHVILPGIWPVLATALLIRSLDLFRIFDAVWQLTRGGPGNRTETLSVFMYVRGFQSFDTSYAAAIVVLLVLAMSVRDGLRPAAHGDQPVSIASILRSVVWYAVSAGHAGRVPLSRLLDGRRIPEGARGDLPLSAGVVPALPATEQLSLHDRRR